jgi:hypothetical protein
MNIIDLDKPSFDHLVSESFNIIARDREVKTPSFSRFEW